MAATESVTDGARRLGFVAGVPVYARPSALRLVVMCVMAAWVFLYTTGNVAVPAFEVLVDRALASFLWRGVLVFALVLCVVAPAFLVRGVRSAFVVFGGLVAGSSVGPVSFVVCVGGWLRALLVAALVVGSLLAHEFGHVLVGRRCGVVSSGVVVTGFGAGAVFDTDGFPSPKAMFATTFAGPFVSLCVAGLIAWGPLLVVAHVPRWWLLASWVGVLVAGANAVPILPLDGGWMAASVVWVARPSLGHAGSRRVYERVSPVLLGVGVWFAGAWGFVFGSEFGVSLFWSLVSLIPVLSVFRKHVSFDAWRARLSLTRSTSPVAVSRVVL